MRRKGGYIIIKLTAHVEYGHSNHVKRHDNAFVRRV